MVGSRQEARFKRENDPADMPADRFVHLPSGRVMCVLCLTTGTARGHVGPGPAEGGPRWQRWAVYSPWQIGCLMDHPWPCSCGRFFRLYAYLWRHIGAPRPAGWGRQDGVDHRLVATSEWSPDQRFFSHASRTPAKALQAAPPLNPQRKS